MWTYCVHNTVICENLYNVDIDVSRSKSNKFDSHVIYWHVAVLDFAGYIKTNVCDYVKKK